MSPDRFLASHRVFTRAELLAALVSICEREGCTVKRTPNEHTGGKFRLRFASVVGGSQNIEVMVILPFLWR